MLRLDWSELKVQSAELSVKELQRSETAKLLAGPSFPWSWEVAPSMFSWQSKTPASIRCYEQ